MVKKVLAFVLAFCMIMSMGAIAVFAENQTSVNDTLAKYTADWYYSADECDYKITAPTEITIGQSDDADKVEITGVTGVAVTVSGPTSITVSSTSFTATTTASVSFAGVTLPISLTAAASDSAKVSASFASGKAPLVKGDYQGTISYTVA